MRAEHAPNTQCQKQIEIQTAVFLSVHHSSWKMWLSDLNNSDAPRLHQFGNFGKCHRIVFPTRTEECEFESEGCVNAKKKKKLHPHLCLHRPRVQVLLCWFNGISWRKHALTWTKLNNLSPESGIWTAVSEPPLADIMRCVDGTHAKLRK